MKVNTLSSENETYKEQYHTVLYMFRFILVESLKASDTESS